MCFRFPRFNRKGMHTFHHSAACYPLFAANVAPLFNRMTYSGANYAIVVSVSHRKYAHVSRPLRAGPQTHMYIAFTCIYIRLKMRTSIMNERRIVHVNDTIYNVSSRNKFTHVDNFSLILSLYFLSSCLRQSRIIVCCSQIRQL